MKKILLSLGILLSPSLAHADPIQLANVHAGMTVEEQKQAVTKDGFTCEDLKTPWETTFIVCKNGKKEIRPSNKKIHINCHTFNACGLSYKELAQFIVDNDVVENMEYQTKFVKSLGENDILIEQYCGRGEDGDVLCVVADKNLFGEILVTITIEKGTLGQGEIKLN